MKRIVIINVSSLVESQNLKRTMDTDFQIIINAVRHWLACS